MRTYFQARPGWEAARRTEIRKAAGELAVLVFVIAVGIALYVVAAPG